LIAYDLRVSHETQTAAFLRVTPRVALTPFDDFASEYHPELFLFG
jgi:hypothetical protein